MIFYTVYVISHSLFSDIMSMDASHFLIKDDLCMKLFKTSVYVVTGLVTTVAIALILMAVYSDRNFFSSFTTAQADRLGDSIQGTSNVTVNPPLSADQLPPVEQFASIAKKDHYQNKVAVLMYHDIDPIKQGGDIITPALFASQLDYLRSKDMNFISLEQFRLFMKGGKVPDNAVLVTFDDGYENFYTTAYPIMKERHIPGVSFVITGDFSKGALVATPHMTKAEIKNMTSSDPNMEVQAHTDKLHYKTSDTTDALTAPLVKDGVTETHEHYLARIENDLRRCVEALRPLTPHVINTFAYPYGLHTPEVEKVAQNVGIRYAFTTELGLVTRDTDLMTIPRINGGSPLIDPERLYNSIMWENKLPGRNLFIPDSIQHSGREAGESEKSDTSK